MRKIPVTMATQHPDNACPSPFTGERFVSASDEIDECYKCFSELGVQEYMWDWEGKFVDEAVIDRMYQNYTDYYKKNQIGKDVFITFRIPNIWEEPSHRLPRAFMNLLSAERGANNYKFHSPPLFEVILPMTTSAKQLEFLQEKFAHIAEASEKIFETKSQFKNLEIIPLVEDFDTMVKVEDILEEYTAHMKKVYKYKPDYYRVFIARSDPTMNLGLIPSMVACKSVINASHKFMKKTGIKVYPWIGSGSLPFRGGVSPERVDQVVSEYQGVYSLSIQSAFRSDFDIKKVKQAIAEFNIRLPHNWKNYEPIDNKDIKKAEEFAKKKSKYFKKVIEKIAPLINEIAGKLPRHRERVQHIGLFGYSRGKGKVKLPRAIKFTGSLYSIGIPPEFIGTGRLLRDAKKEGVLHIIEKLYVNLKSDLLFAGNYLNRENLELLSEEDDVWNDVKEDIELCEEYLGTKVGPQKIDQMIHRNFTSNIFYKNMLKKDFSEDVLRAAEIRKSLG